MTTCGMFPFSQSIRQSYEPPQRGSLCNAQASALNWLIATTSDTEELFSETRKSRPPLRIYDTTFQIETLDSAVVEPVSIHPLHNYSAQLYIQKPR